MPSDRGENGLGASATVSSLPAERIASGLPTLQVCIVAPELSGLVKTIDSVERAVEVAISREAIFSASLQIASLRGDWSRENDGGILSKPRSHIYSVRAHDVGEQESKAGAYNILMSSATMDIVVMVQGGSLLATNALVYLAEALRHAPTALAGARRLPVEIVAPYDPSTGRTGYMDPFCGAISGPRFRDLQGFDAVYFPNHLFTVDLSWRARAAGFACVREPAAMFFLDDGAESSNVNADLIEETILLAHKWSRPDVVDHLLSLCGAKDDLHDVPARYRYRSENGFLPAPIEGGARYAAFSGDCFPSLVWKP